MTTKEYYRRLNEIKEGDLLAWSSHSTSWLGKVVQYIIRFFTLSEFVHVGVVVNKHPLSVIEAVSPKVSLNYVKLNIPFYHIAMHTTISERQIHLAKQNMIDKPYSIMDAIRGYFGVVTKDENRWQCVELAKTFYEYNDIIIDVEKLTPSDFVTACLKRPNAKIVYLDRPLYRQYL